MRSSTSGKPNFALKKTVHQQTQISKTYDILDKDTNKLWKAKVYDLQKAQQLNVQQIIELNGQILQEMKFKSQSVIYLEKVLTIENKQYHIVEMYEERLSQYMSNKNQKGIKDQGQVVLILQNVLQSVCDIYKQDYMVLNLRPQHIVRVQDGRQSKWKIQSFVLDYSIFGFKSKCEYQFDYDWASNQEKQKKQNLQEKYKDQQIVWYMGILALRLIYGNSFKINAKFKDSDLNLSQIKNKCNPNVFQLIQKSVKQKLKDRIPLKQFLKLKLFQNVQIPQEAKQKFLDGFKSRIIKSQILRSSINQKSVIKKKQLKSSIKPTSSRFTSSLQSSKGVGKLTKTPPQKPSYQIDTKKVYNQFKWTLQKCLYLGEIKKYTQSTACFSNVSTQDKVLIRYIYLKIAGINIQNLRNQLQSKDELKQLKQNQTMKDLLNEIQNQVQNHQKSQEKSIKLQLESYESKLKKVNPSKFVVFSNCQKMFAELLQLVGKDKHENDQLNFMKNFIEYFKIVSGKFYSGLKRDLDEQGNRQITGKILKKRALSYFAFCSYFILINWSSLSDVISEFKEYTKGFYEQQVLSRSIHVKFEDQMEYIRMCDYNQRAEEKILIEHSQRLINKYFQIVDKKNANILGLLEINKQGKRRPSIYANKSNLSVNS